MAGFQTGDSPEEIHEQYPTVDFADRPAARASGQLMIQFVDDGI